jgi:hypothetical protein
MNRTKKLIDNVMKWRRYAKERDGLGLLISGLIEDVLFPVAQEGWDVGGEECVRKVRLLFFHKQHLLMMKLCRWLVLYRKSLYRQHSVRAYHNAQRPEIDSRIGQKLSGLSQRTIRRLSFRHSFSILELPSRRAHMKCRS